MLLAMSTFTKGNFSTSVSAFFLLKISLLEMLIAFGNEHLKRGKRTKKIANIEKVSYREEQEEKVRILTEEIRVLRKQVKTPGLVFPKFTLQGEWFEEAD